MPFKDQHPLYATWCAMRRRCQSPAMKQYSDYGGRGIRVCERWSSFKAFAEDMGERPPGHSLDRIDNDGDYSPENCRWASRSEQQRNQRRAVYVDIRGTRYRAIELAEIAGVKVDTIVYRANNGLPYDQVMSPEPLHNYDAASLAVGAQKSKALRLAKTHCPHGHEYTPDNLVASKLGFRKCKTCHREKARQALRLKAAVAGGQDGV